MRRAVTLLEVLISMFILTVGLLSIASLVPAGKIQQSRGDETVRASACGRAAFRELSIRGILNPKNWARPHDDFPQLYKVSPPLEGYNYEFTAWAPVPPTPERLYSKCPFPYIPVSGATSHIGIVVDPLGVEHGYDKFFPYGHTPATDPVLPRITLGGPWGGISPGPEIRKAMANEIFACHDELVFEIPPQADALPVQKTYDPTASGNAIKKLSQDSYTWLATIVPDPKMINASNWQSVPCRVSVVVFHGRGLTIPGSGERIANLSNLTGNGEIEISVNAVAAAGKVTVASQYSGNGEGPAHLGVKKQGWVMIAGFDDLDGNHTTSLDRVWQYRWYRIIGADSTIDAAGKEVTEKSSGSGPWTKRLTIEGADWDVSSYSAPLLTQFKDQARVFLFDDIVNVYEKSMTLEVDSAY